MSVKASLFGLDHSNRDFAKTEAWGKNQFNSSFPAALACYLDHQGLEANYISIVNKKFGISSIKIADVFGINPKSSDIYFAFEAQHTPFQKYVVGSLPRTDLVVQNSTTGQCLKGIEIKLTALPDNTTRNLSDDKFGCEIVIRPDTIVYLAASMVSKNLVIVNDHIKAISVDIKDWSDATEVSANIEKIINCIANIGIDIEQNQSSFLMQPVWKTLGKSPRLADNCLDLFVWSDAAFAWFIAQISLNGISGN